MSARSLSSFNTRARTLSRPRCSVGKSFFRSRRPFRRQSQRPSKMGEQKPQNVAPPAGPAPWHVPVMSEDIPETGRHFDLQADAQVRAAVAAVAGLRELPRLQASFDVTRRGAEGLHVTGSVSATVGQTCVVTLEPLASEIAETVDLEFVAQQAPA